MRTRMMDALWVARMPLLVGVIVTACLTSVGTLIARAGSTASIGIEPDYYRKGLEWDRLQSDRRRSAALGWNAEVAVDARAARVVVRLHDPLKMPLEGAVITGEVFAHSDSVCRVAISPAAVEGEPGVYAAEMGEGRRPAAGKWRVCLTATRGADCFIIERDVEVAAR